MMAIDAISPVPKAIETTIETAYTRTPSAAARVTRKMAAVSVRSSGPKRRSINSYAV